MNVMLVCPEAMAQGAHRVEAPWCLHIIATDVAIGNAKTACGE